MLFRQNIQMLRSGQLRSIHLFLFDIDYDRVCAVALVSDCDFDTGVDRLVAAFVIPVESCDTVVDNIACSVEIIFLNVVDYAHETLALVRVCVGVLAALIGEVFPPAVVAYRGFNVSDTDSVAVRIKVVEPRSEIAVVVIIRGHVLDYEKFRVVVVLKFAAGDNDAVSVFGLRVIERE